MECVNCGGKGACVPCRGTGFSGYFAVGHRCRWCDGSGKCHLCMGTGQVSDRSPGFRPLIYVHHSQGIPQPIFAAVLSGGAPWRFLAIPDGVAASTQQRQRGWVQWRCRTHFRFSRGICPCFGKITGYEWRRTNDLSVFLNVRGRVTGIGEPQAVADNGILTFRGRVLPFLLAGSTNLPCKAPRLQQVQFEHLSALR